MAFRECRGTTESWLSILLLVVLVAVFSMAATTCLFAFWWCHCAVSFVFPSQILTERSPEHRQQEVALHSDSRFRQRQGTPQTTAPRRLSPDSSNGHRQTRYSFPSLSFQRSLRRQGVQADDRTPFACKTRRKRLVEEQWLRRSVKRASSLLFFVSLI